MPEAPPPRDLVADKPGCSSDQPHLHPNGDMTLSPAVPSPDPAVTCIIASELTGRLDLGLGMTGEPRLSASPLHRPSLSR